MRIIAGTARGRKLSSPPGERTRPLLDRVREALFSILGARIAGAHVLDLYAGTGSIGLEALSRGAAACVFVERDREALECLKSNVTALGFAERARIVRGRVEDQLLRPPEECYDAIFFDPPYAELRSASRRAGTLELARRLYAERLAAEGLLVFHYPRDLLEANELLRLGPCERRAWGTTEIAIFDRAELDPTGRNEGPVERRDGAGGSDAS
jgi:16S rRNA (guanine966-N2)-methyltransferase